MSNPILNISVPTVNPNLPSLGPVNDDKDIKSKQVFDSCAKFTAESAQIAFSPEFSLFLQGIQMINRPSGGDYLSGFDQGMGVIMLMASPVWEVLRIGIGLPCALGGAIATIATGTVHVAGGSVKHLFTPSEASRQREELTKKFVERMHTILNGLAYIDQHFFKENPAQLINIAALSVAFLSRKVKGKCLMVGDQVLKKEDIANQDEKHKGYFNTICEMKCAIQSLNLSLDDAHAWNFLIHSLEQLQTEERSLSITDRNQKETLRLLVNFACDLSAQIIDDKVFKQVWQASL